MNKDSFILYVEDDPLNREQGLIALNKHNITNVLAPTSAMECRKMIAEKNIAVAIMDYQLKDWRDPNEEWGLTLGEKERTDGVEIAEYLRECHPHMPIGIFTSFGSSLRQRLEQTQIAVNMLLMDDIYNFIPEYLNTFFELKIEAIPLYSSQNPLPIEAQLYYCKKIHTFLNAGLHIWKAGKYAWQVAINVEEKKSDLNRNNRQYAATGEDRIAERFIARIDKNDFYLAEFHIPAEDIHLCRSELLDAEMDDALVLPVGNYCLLAELIYVKFITHLYLDGSIDFQRAIKDLLKCSLSAQLESQKILFKELQHRHPAISTKEELYVQMEEFSKAGFPRILDIYKGMVESVDEEYADISFVSCAPEQVTRTDEFPADLLNKYCLEENSAFEYTILKPIYGGYGYHIEPL